MERAILSCVFLLVATYPGGMEVAAQDVVLERIGPAADQLPCASQTVMYQCRVLVPSLGLTWTLPNDGTLEFSGASNEGAVRPSPPGDGVYTATLTNKTEDDDPGTDRFFFTSTLLILETVNDTNLTCSGGTVANPVMTSTDIIVSGVPDPPSGLYYDDTVVIESSVTLQWTRPSYTGGVSLMNYSVSANGQTWPVSDMGEMVSYTTSGLVYGEVQVTAINSCGQRSMTTSINIPSSAPPTTQAVSVEFSCDVSQVDPVPVTVNLIYGHRKEGVVYPGNEEISIELFPGPSTCYFLSDTTSCTVEIPRDIYDVTINRTNSIGSTVDHFSMIDVRVLAVVEQTSLRVNRQLLSIVTVRRNSECPETSSPVLVTFGARPANGGECVGQQNATATPIPPGATASFFVDAGSISLGSEEALCYVVSLNGATVVTGDSSSNVSTAITTGGGDNCFTSATAGIVVAATLLVTLPVGVAFCCCGMWFIKSRGRRAFHGNQGKRDKRELVAVYEDPDRMKTEFSVSNNQAYGQIGTTPQ